MHHFDGTTASEVWQQAATALCAWDMAQYGQHGVARELLHVTMSLHDPRQRWVNVRTPPINPAFAIAEVVWILTGRNDAAFLTLESPIAMLCWGDADISGSVWLSVAVSFRH